MSFFQALSSVPEAGGEGADCPVTELYKRSWSQGILLMTNQLGAGQWERRWRKPPMAHGPSDNLQRI